MTDLSRKISTVTSDDRQDLFLFQLLSVTLRRRLRFNVILLHRSGEPDL